MKKLRTKEYETGKLVKYEWDQGWKVVPRIGGQTRAQGYGIGLAPNIAEGQRRLDHLAANEDDGWESRSMSSRWSPPEHCVYSK